MALSDNLVSFWLLGEASGSRADSVGSNTLTANNTPGNVTGRVGNAVQLVSASSQALSIADGSQTNLDPGTSDFAVSLWVYPDTLPALATLFFKGAAAGGTGQDGYWLFSGSTGALTLRFTDGSAGFVTTTTATGVLSSGAWHHIVVNFSRAGNAEIFVNGTSRGTLNISAQNGDCNGIRPFCLGASNAGSFGNFLNGRLDACGFWLRTLDSTDRSALYNSGNGAEYPFGGGFNAAWAADVNTVLGASGAML